MFTIFRSVNVTKVDDLKEHFIAQSNLVKMNFKGPADN